MKKFYITNILLLCTLLGVYAQSLQATYKGRYTSGYFSQDGGVMEISAYDPATKKLFTINGNADSLEIIDLSNPSLPVLSSVIDMSSYGGGTNSIAIKNGIVACAVQATVAQNAGSVVFFTASTGAFLKTVTVGALPDMLTFTPDGNKVVVANEGEPSVGYTADPEGSISVIDISTGVANATVTNINFNAFDSQKASLKAKGIRIFGGSTFGANGSATVSQDLEPEYIVVAADSKTAWVVCQENNAMVILNLTNNTISALKPLGLKNHNLAGNTLDASDRFGANPSNAVNMQNWPVFGMYMPDGLATMRYNNATYILTANEGDARDYGVGFIEEARASTLDWDNTLFPNETTQKLVGNLGRLTLTNVNGNYDADADYDSLFVFGARSFSIWDSSMVQVYDSGDDIEQYIAANYEANFNSNHNGSNARGNRSDNKGPEPETIVTAKIGDSTYAFVGLERISAVMVYNVTNPTNPKFLQYLTTRNFAEVPLSTTGGPTTMPRPLGGDLGPEGLLYIPASESPNGKPHIVVSYEVSGTITTYELAAPLTAEPTNASSALNFTGVNTTSLTVNWTNGNGAKHIVVIKQGAAVDSDPVDGTIYTNANAAFGSGTQLGTGNYVVYVGTGNSVTVTGLTASTTYHVEIYEYNGYEGSENYLTSSTLVGNQATASVTGLLDYQSTDSENGMFYAYPNPINSDVLFMNKLSDVKVYNAVGDVVLEQTKAKELNIVSLKKGIYVIKNAQGIAYKFIRE